MLSLLYDLDIPLIGIVKNSYSRLLMDLMGSEKYLDSDFFSFHLSANERTAFFVYDDPRIDIRILDLRPVASYYMTPNQNLLRIEVPYWVYESMGPERIMNIVQSDVILGGGSYSFILGKADKWAKFNEYERKNLLMFLKDILNRSGFHEDKFFNHSRWGLHSLRKRGL
jgi:hypothetical protein